MTTERILVTGAAGFLGRHVLAQLEGLGLAVAGVSRVPLVSRIQTFTGDLLDSKFVGEALAEFRPTRIVHAAGIVSSRHDSDLGELLKGNVMALAVVLRSAAGAASRPKVVSLSSSAVYGSGHAGPVAEDAPLRPTTPYGLSKAAGEVVASCFEALAHRVMILRPFNVIGPGMPSGTLLGDVADQIVAGASVRVGDLSARRDFLDVRDAAWAIGALALLDTDVSCVNVGSGVSYPVAEAVATMQRVAGPGVRITQPAARDGARLDIPDQTADVSLLRRLLPAWQPTRVLDDTVRDILEDRRKTVGHGP